MHHGRLHYSCLNRHEKCTDPLSDDSTDRLVFLSVVGTFFWTIRLLKLSKLNVNWSAQCDPAMIEKKLSEYRPGRRRRYKKKKRVKKPQNHDETASIAMDYWP